MNPEFVEIQVKFLIEKAAKADVGEDAAAFSQAAIQVVEAARILKDYQLYGR